MFALLNGRKGVWKMGAPCGEEGDIMPDICLGVTELQN
jgi:hypothetical protein